jgi:hypothetical protein
MTIKFDIKGKEFVNASQFNNVELLHKTCCITYKLKVYFGSGV